MTNFFFYRAESIYILADTLVTKVMTRMSDEASGYVIDTVEDTAKLLKKQVRPIVAACNQTAYDVQKVGDSIDGMGAARVDALVPVRRHGRALVKRLNRMAARR